MTTNLKHLLMMDPTSTGAPEVTLTEGAAPDPAPPPLWWLRPDVPDTWLHRADPARAGYTACNLRLNSHFRPATSDEVRTRRKCRHCVPRPAHAPKRARRG